MVYVKSPGFELKLSWGSKGVCKGRIRGRERKVRRPGGLNLIDIVLSISAKGRALLECSTSTLTALPPTAQTKDKRSLLPFRRTIFDQIIEVRIPWKCGVTWCPVCNAQRIWL
jgi:hypothetical protein